MNTIPPDSVSLKEILERFFRDGTVITGGVCSKLFMRTLWKPEVLRGWAGYFNERVRFSQVECRTRAFLIVNLKRLN